MTPRSSTGAKSADRAPTTTRASPRRTRCHASRRCTSVIPLCSTATAPKRDQEPPDGLGRERDLRHQHDRPLAALEGRLDQAQVDLRLAAPRDAMEQRRAAAPLIQRLGEPLDRRPLVRRELGVARPRLGDRPRGGHRRAATACSSTARPLLDQRADGPVGDVELLDDVDARDGPTRLEQGPKDPVLLRVGRALQLREPGFVHALGWRHHHHRPAAALALQRRREHGRERLAPGARVVVGHPSREVEQVFVEHRLRVQHLGDGLQAARGDVSGLPGGDDDGDLTAPGEGHHHPHPRLDARLQLRGDRVRVLAPHGPIQGDLGEELRSRPLGASGAGSSGAGSRRTAALGLTHELGPEEAVDLLRCP